MRAFEPPSYHARDERQLQWHGTITSVQPRIRLLRSFDERSHSYLGYVLQLDGEVGGERRVFTVATLGRRGQESDR